MSTSVLKEWSSPMRQTITGEQAPQGGVQETRQYTQNTRQEVRTITPMYKTGGTPGSTHLTNGGLRPNTGPADYKEERQQDHFRLRMIEPKTANLPSLPDDTQHRPRTTIADFPSQHSKRSFLKLDPIAQRRPPRSVETRAITTDTYLNESLNRHRDTDHSVLKDYLKVRERDVNKNWDKPDRPGAKTNDLLREMGLKTDYTSKGASSRVYTSTYSFDRSLTRNRQSNYQNRTPTYDPVLIGSNQIVYESQPKPSGAISERTKVYQPQERVVFENAPKPHHTIGHFSRQRAQHPDENTFENQEPHLRPIDLSTPTYIADQNQQSAFDYNIYRTNEQQSVPAQVSSQNRLPPPQIVSVNEPQGISNGFQSYSSNNRQSHYSSNQSLHSSYNTYGQHITQRRQSAAPILPFGSHNSLLTPERPQHLVIVPQTHPRSNNGPVTPPKPQLSKQQFQSLRQQQQQSFSTYVKQTDDFYRSSATLEPAGINSASTVPTQDSMYRSTPNLNDNAHERQLAFQRQQEINLLRQSEQQAIDRYRQYKESVEQSRVNLEREQHERRQSRYSSQTLPTPQTPNSATWRRQYPVPSPHPQDIVRSSSVLADDREREAYYVDYMGRRQAFIEKQEPPPSIQRTGKVWQPPPDRPRPIPQPRRPLRQHDLMDDGEYKWRPSLYEPDFKHERKNFTPEHSPPPSELRRVPPVSPMPGSLDEVARRQNVGLVPPGTRPRPVQVQVQMRQVRTPSVLSGTSAEMPSPIQPYLPEPVQFTDEPVVLPPHPSTLTAQDRPAVLTGGVRRRVRQMETSTPAPQQRSRTPQPIPVQQQESHPHHRHSKTSHRIKRRQSAPGVVPPPPPPPPHRHREQAQQLSRQNQQSTTPRKQKRSTSQYAQVQTNHYPNSHTQQSNSNTQRRPRIQSGGPTNLISNPSNNSRSQRPYTRPRTMGDEGTSADRFCKLSRGLYGADSYQQPQCFYQLQLRSLIRVRANSASQADRKSLQRYHHITTSTPAKRETDDTMSALNDLAEVRKRLEEKAKLRKSDYRLVESEIHKTNPVRAPPAPQSHLPPPRRPLSPEERSQSVAVMEVKDEVVSVKSSGYSSQASDADAKLSTVASALTDVSTATWQFSDQAFSPRSVVSINGYQDDSGLLRVRTDLSDSLLDRSNARVQTNMSELNDHYQSTATTHTSNTVNQQQFQANANQMPFPYVLVPITNTASTFQSNQNQGRYNSLPQLNELDNGHGTLVHIQDENARKPNKSIMKRNQNEGSGGNKKDAATKTEEITRVEEIERTIRTHKKKDKSRRSGGGRTHESSGGYHNGGVQYQQQPMMITQGPGRTDESYYRQSTTRRNRSMYRGSSRSGHQMGQVGVNDSIRRGELRYTANGDVRERRHSTRATSRNSQHRGADIYGYLDQGNTAHRRANSSYAADSRRSSVMVGGTPIVEYPPTLPRGPAPQPPPHRNLPLQMQQNNPSYFGGGNGTMMKSRSFADWEDGRARDEFTHQMRRFDDGGQQYTTPLKREFDHTIQQGMPMGPGRVDERDHRTEKIPGGYETFSRENKADQGIRYGDNGAQKQFAESKQEVHYKRETASNQPDRR